MTHSQDPGGQPKARRRKAGADAPASGRGGHDKPAWAEGIRKLYDAVTQEPLPPDFQILLEQLGQLRKQ